MCADLFLDLEGYCWIGVKDKNIALSRLISKHMNSSRPTRNKQCLVALPVQVGKRTGTEHEKQKSYASPQAMS